jgi:hypothetical protein
MADENQGHFYRIISARMAGNRFYEEFHDGNSRSVLCAIKEMN